MITINQTTIQELSERAILLGRADAKIKRTKKHQKIAWIVFFIVTAATLAL